MGITIQVTEEARGWLAERGYDPVFGARPLRRTLQREVESPLSRKLLGGEFKSGDVVKVAVREDELFFEALSVSNVSQEVAA